MTTQAPASHAGEAGWSPGGRALAGLPFKVWLAFLVLLAGLVAHARSYFYLRLDDAFIALRYADNLRHGLGMTFNPGERVEGFTCPALVVLEAGFDAVGFDALFVVKLLGIACGAVVLWLTMRLAFEASRSPLVAALAGLVLVVQPELPVSMVNGLETIFEAACVMGALASSLLIETTAGAVLTALLLAAAILFRPDGALFAVLVAATQLMRERGSTLAWRRVLVLTAVCLAIVFPLELWKAIYFGSWIPATALAKVPAHGTERFVSGIGYLWRLSLMRWELIGWAALPVLGFWGGRIYRTWAVVALVWVAYVVSIGGDWMPGGRFVLSVLPLAAIAFAEIVVRLGRAAWIARLRTGNGLWRKVPGAALAGALVATLAWSTPRDLRRVRGLADVTTATVVAGCEQLGAYLRRAPARSAVALLDIGAVGYYSGLKIIDLGGLTNLPIARILHEGGGRFSGHLYFPDDAAARRIADHVLDARPEVIVLTLSDIFAGPTHTLAVHRQEREIARDPRFRDGYRYLCSLPEAALGVRLPLAYNVFARKDVSLIGVPADGPHHMVQCPQTDLGRIVTTPS